MPEDEKSQILPLVFNLHKAVWCEFEDSNSKTTDLAKICPFGPNWDQKSINCQFRLNICQKLSKILAFCEYEAFSSKTKDLTQLGPFGPNIGPNQDLNSENYKFRIKIY